MRTFLVPVFAALAIGTGTVAAASEVKITINYSDLDLSDPADMKVLEDRIDDTIKHECKTRSSVSAIRNYVDENCVEAAKIAVMDELAKRQEAVMEVAAR